jgi:formylglycine-generating enzyme required for sulfatase activity
MVWIEPGRFLMGSGGDEPERCPEEGPRHEVCIDRGFYLGVSAVTQAQWASVMETHPWDGVPCVHNHPDHPAVCISWEDAHRFLEALERSTDVTGAFRLPTEAEWEYTCRAGTQTPWSFGDEEALLDDFGWYFWNAWHADLRYAQPVARKQPNAWGLYDMHGNIWEWCQDQYGPYGTEPSTTGSYRVVRGGDFNRGAPDCRSAARAAHLPPTRSCLIGARVVYEAKV